MDKSETDIHYQFIELLSYWQGSVNTTALIEQFKISRQQAHKYLSQYQQRHPANLSYCQSSKAFLPTAQFCLYAISDDATPYLDWLSQVMPSQSLSGNDVSHQPVFTDTSLSLPTRPVSPQVMRGLVAAIKQQRRIEVDYVSLTNPDGEGRIIQPHIFVKTGLRWHLRAYDEKHKEFRDFVLSRFRGEPELLDKATHTAKQDQGWNTTVSIILIADQRLSPQQKAVIEQDYQMQNGQLVIETRAALTQYLLQALQLNTKMIEPDPCAQQIILSNPNDIKPWLFNT
ncbi:WYL domain-containing protein [Paraglaciecola sp.]|uniref:helix-turn-helix transcriptional regulator n=1 Tax=Paraglaciecola sp. TaxID=1920173 RepID=UPI0030F3B782